MAQQRRSREEVRKLVEQARQMMRDGGSAQKAAKHVGLARSVLNKHLKNGTSGSVNVNSIPPRPKRGGHRKSKRLDLNDVGKVAHRISVIDRKVARMRSLAESMLQERKGLAARLIAILK